jgi:hypothetical protein
MIEDNSAWLIVGLFVAIDFAIVCLLAVIML